jgi:hypothetical protein
MKFILNILRIKILKNIYSHYIVIFIFLSFFTWALFYYDFFPLAQSETSNFLLPSHYLNDNLESWSTFYMGHRNSISLNFITFFITYFLKYNFPFPFLSQYLFYFTIFFIGILGRYKLLGLFDNSNNFKIHKLYLSLLILINPAFLFLINRFQYSFLTLYLLFPLIFYLSVKIFNSKSNYLFIKYIILLRSVNNLFNKKKTILKRVIKNFHCSLLVYKGL